MFVLNTVDIIKHKYINSTFLEPIRIRCLYKDTLSIRLEPDVDSHTEIFNTSHYFPFLFPCPVYNTFKFQDVPMFSISGGTSSTVHKRAISGNWSLLSSPRSLCSIKGFSNFPSGSATQRGFLHQERPVDTHANFISDWGSLTHILTHTHTHGTMHSPLLIHSNNLYDPQQLAGEANRDSLCVCESLVQQGAAVCNAVCANLWPDGSINLCGLYNTQAWQSYVMSNTQWFEKQPRPARLINEM